MFIDLQCVVHFLSLILIQVFVRHKSTWDSSTLQFLSVFNYCFDFVEYSDIVVSSLFYMDQTILWMACG